MAYYNPDGSYNPMHHPHEEPPASARWGAIIGLLLITASPFLLIGGAVLAIIVWRLP